MKTLREEFPHYYRRVPSEFVDVYRLLEVYEIASPSLQHAIKKLFAAGKRGAKDAEHDVDEAIKSLRRWQEMRQEDGAAAKRDAAAIVRSVRSEEEYRELFGHPSGMFKGRPPVAFARFSGCRECLNFGATCSNCLAEDT